MAFLFHVYLSVFYGMFGWWSLETGVVQTALGCKVETLESSTALVTACY